LRVRPEAAQPLGLVSLASPFALLTWLKIGAAAAVAAYVAFHAGQWVGERAGYQRHAAEVAAATARLNAELATLEADLAAAKARLDGARAAEANAARGSLADFPAALSRECADKCSMPARARSGLEAIR